jgi:hypothetical protein
LGFFDTVHEISLFADRGCPPHIEPLIAAGIPLRYFLISWPAVIIHATQSSARPVY